MEKLIARQAELFENINRIKSNFVKDSDSRKTPEYLEERLNRLENLWVEFHQNHNALGEFKVIASREQYFSENIYDSTMKLYHTTQQLINSFSKQFEKTPIRSAVGASSSKADKGTAPCAHIDDLLGEQRTQFRALRRLINNINIEELSEKWELEDELRCIQNRWNAIENLHLKIDNILHGSDGDYEDEFSTYESSYRRIKRSINQKLSSTAHTLHSTPQLDIPTFSGNYANWPTFFDLFTETIHNSKVLSNGQKMQHLKGKLRGEAERLIQHLNISAENYETAWEILTHRYNNPQLLFTKQVEIFLNQPNIQHQSSFELKRLHDTSMETLHAIYNLGIDTTTWDPLIVHIISKKLDAATYSDYMESRKQPRDLPSLIEFMSFLENKFIALEPIRKRELSSYRPKTNNDNFKPNHNFSKSNYQHNKTVSFKPNLQSKYHLKNNTTYQAIATSSKNKCPNCYQYHEIYQCNKFNDMSSEDKLKTVSRLRLCMNCLYHHYGNKCISQKRCKICNMEHNTLMHDACITSFASQNSNAPAKIYGLDFQQLTKASNTSAHSQKENMTLNVNYVANNNEEVLLTTVLLNIKSYDGNFITFKALLDQGSQISLISESAVQKLGLRRNKYSASILGIGNGPKQSKGIVSIQCRSFKGSYQFETQALIVSKVINNLPNSSFNKQSWPHLQNLNLADPEYNISKPIDILLDANVYSDIIMSGLVKGPQDAPIAQQTKLGWILSGNVKKSFTCNVVINKLGDISKYWELEDITLSSTSLNQEEELCEEIYQKTTKRLRCGKYEVTLPLKTSFEEELGLSNSKALAQYQHLEQKLSKNNNLAKMYTEFMNEYQQLGHMVKVKNNKPLCYLPHHGVWKVDSDTTKLRVVFNASSKTTSGKSLNDLMLRGPNLQQDIHNLIVNWRQYQFVMSADIEKMFRMINISEAYQPLQTILWRNSSTEPISEYFLTTVTYGTKAAPYLAMRTLRQVAKDDGDRYPLAVDVLNNKYYTDDLFYGSNSIQEAKEVQRQLIGILKGAGFNLRKWSSNHQYLLQGLSKEQVNPGVTDFKDCEPTKTLGLRWNSASDTFSFKNISYIKQNKAKYTKRQLLSNISKVFDPIGWLSPITVKAKLLFQQAWSTGLSWDDELSDDIQSKWLQLQSDLENLEKFSIPRHLGNTNYNYELHGFCDASEKVYACSIYIRTKNDKGEYITRLITAKTKLAPLNKTVSLPRLELCGALLLSQLMKKVKDTLDHENIKTFAWTDSMVVLGWLQGDINRWKPFVANRVQQIVNIISSSQWRHVISEENPSDCATRGLNSNQLLNHSLWWEGPVWLKNINIDNQEIVKYQTPLLEAKKIHVNTALCENNLSFINELLQNNSSITRAVKIIAWILRFIRNTRRKNADRTSTLSSVEIHNAYNIIIKHVQANDFEIDIKNLKNKGFVTSNSRLISFNPYLDKDGILRIGGRLNNSHINENSKHPHFFWSFEPDMNQRPMDGPVY